MKRDYIKSIIIGLFTLVTIVILFINARTECSEFWTINIGDGIEIFILLFVSFFLVHHQNELDRKKEKISSVVSKIQEKIIEPGLIRVDTDENKKVTRIKLTSISNLLEIIKDDVKDKKNLEVILNDMDTLSSTVMDHIDDIDYIEKSYPQIERLVSNVETKLEQIKFELN